MKKQAILLTVFMGIIFLTSCEKTEEFPFESSVPLTLPNRQKEFVPPTDVDRSQLNLDSTSFNTDPLLSELNSPQEFNSGCDLLPAAAYARLDRFPDPNSVEVLPLSFSLPCPPVLSQGGEGSCVAWGVGYSARSISCRFRYGQVSYAPNLNLFSPEYIFNQIKLNAATCYGSYVSSALNLLKNQGVCRWSVMPYSGTNGCSIQPTNIQLKDGSFYRISNWGTVTRNVANFKNLLYSNKAIIVAGPVDATYSNHGPNQVISTYNRATSTGNHCYTVVGWDDRLQAFKVMNSWGTGWGTNGFGYISYGMLSTLFVEAYVLNG